jgi:hypothetical protein
MRTAYWQWGGVRAACSNASARDYRKLRTEVGAVHSAVPCSAVRSSAAAATEREARESAAVGICIGIRIGTGMASGHLTAGCCCPLRHALHVQLQSSFVHWMAH